MIIKVGNQQTPHRCIMLSNESRGFTMDSTQRVLLVGEVATLLRESKRSVYRQYKQGKLPMPLPMPGKLRWLASDIEAFLESRAPLVNVPTTTKQCKKQEREYQERQRKADQTLQRHERNRKAKGKSGNE
jgi:predicted DNA-binding transcriptional regulator AlpA